MSPNYAKYTNFKDNILNTVRAAHPTVAIYTNLKGKHLLTLLMLLAFKPSRLLSLSLIRLIVKGDKARGLEGDKAVSTQACKLSILQTKQKNHVKTWLLKFYL